MQNSGRSFFNLMAKGISIKLESKCLPQVLVVTNSITIPATMVLQQILNMLELVILWIQEAGTQTPWKLILRGLMTPTVGFSVRDVRNLGRLTIDTKLAYRS